MTRIPPPVGPRCGCGARWDSATLEGTTITYHPCGHVTDLFVNATNEHLVDMLLTEPIGWDVEYGAFSAHGEHNYDAGCALCRMDRQSLRVVVQRILDELERPRPTIP